MGGWADERFSRGQTPKLCKVGENKAITIFSYKFTPPQPTIQREKHSMEETKYRRGAAEPDGVQEEDKSNQLDTLYISLSLPPLALQSIGLGNLESGLLWEVGVVGAKSVS